MKIQIWKWRDRTTGSEPKSESSPTDWNKVSALATAAASLLAACALYQNTVVMKHSAEQFKISMARTDSALFLTRREVELNKQQFDYEREESADADKKLTNQFNLTLESNRNLVGKISFLAAEFNSLNKPKFIVNMRLDTAFIKDSVLVFDVFLLNSGKRMARDITVNVNGEKVVEYGQITQCAMRFDKIATDELIKFEPCVVFPGQKRLDNVPAISFVVDIVYSDPLNNEILNQKEKFFWQGSIGNVFHSEVLKNDYEYEWTTVEDTQ